MFVCELAALLHDVADAKLAGDEATGQRRVRDWLEAHGVAPDVTAYVMEIIATMSFAGGNRPPMRTLEGRVVQDADRLDAIGAIGIARAFALAARVGARCTIPASSRASTRTRPSIAPAAPPPSTTSTKSCYCSKTA